MDCSIPKAGNKSLVAVWMLIYHVSVCARACVSLRVALYSYSYMKSAGMTLIGRQYFNPKLKKDHGK